MNAWKSAVTFLCMVLALCCHSLGQGGPPVIGDDPGTPGNGHWEINLACPFLQTAHANTFDLPYIDANYGLGDHIELSYQGGLLFGKNTGEVWHGGYDNSLFGVKWRFLDQEAHGLDMSIYPQLGFNTTSSFASIGLADSGATFFIPVEVAKTFGKIEVDAEVGYQYREHDRDQWAGGPIIGYLLNDRIELLMESRFVFDQDFRSNDLVLDAGARMNLVNHIQSLIAIGRGLRNGDDSPHLYLYLGLGITF